MGQVNMKITKLGRLDPVKKNMDKFIESWRGKSRGEDKDYYELVEKETSSDDGVEIAMDFMKKAGEVNDPNKKKVPQTVIETIQQWFNPDKKKQEV